MPAHPEPHKTKNNIGNENKLDNFGHMQRQNYSISRIYLTLQHQKAIDTVIALYASTC